MAADLLPVEGVASILVVQRERMAEKVAKDFFREEWVGEPYIMVMEDSEGVLGLMEAGVVGQGVREVTLGEEVERMSTTPVGVGEGRTMLVNTIRAIVVTTPVGMERSLSHFLRVYNSVNVLLSTFPLRAGL